jgi:DNA-binding transcriptional ArsR family regulator
MTEVPDEHRLLAQIAALASPHRLQLVALLGRERRYVSELARAIGLSRPLTHMHLQKLEAAGLVSSELELSADGKAVRYFVATDFSLVLSPAAIAAALEAKGDPT